MKVEIGFPEGLNVQATPKVNFEGGVPYYRIDLDLEGCSTLLNELGVSSDQIKDLTIIFTTKIDTDRRLIVRKAAGAFFSSSPEVRLVVRSLWPHDGTLFPRKNLNKTLIHELTHAGHWFVNSETDLDLLKKSEIRKEEKRARRETRRLVKDKRWKELIKVK